MANGLAVVVCCWSEGLKKAQSLNVSEEKWWNNSSEDEESYKFAGGMTPQGIIFST